MRRKCFSQGAGLLLFLSLEFLEESYKSVRIVARFVHVLQAEIISLRLKTAGELEESHRQANADRFTGCVTDTATHKNQGNTQQVGQFSPGGVARRVPSGNVGNFMGHHARQFGLFVGSQNEPCINVEKTTW